MDTISPYEKQRQLNIEKNRQMLEELGLFKPFSTLPPTKSKKLSTKPGKKRKRESVEVKDENEKIWENSEHFNQANRKDHVITRRSLRVRGITPEYTSKCLPEVNDGDYVIQKPVNQSKRENSFGSIPGIEVGTTWSTRVECSRDGVHRPTVAGIHGSETEGCYSLALSGGYEDDIDLGDRFTYTGEGGRDLKGTKANPKNLRTAPQSKNQTLTKGNLALSQNVKNRRPVRVIRGYKLNSEYAPEEGYRYDGLYTVEKYWEDKGLSGFLVFKFILKRCPCQEEFTA